MTEHMTAASYATRLQDIAMLNTVSKIDRQTLSNSYSN